ncbi:MAG: ATP-dependent DNA helicase DinG [Gammaproteobacteria bacterium]|nr:ATP-dependent DNA helicase DinG [Gammaproteobacteria bacterium]
MGEADLPDAPATALTDELKATIQTAYSTWLGHRGFKARRGQRQMIADIARGLTENDRLCVVEAGTGTGKTAAYCLAAIPIAKAQEKRVVISTATVALQEQVALRDLPDLKAHADLDFSFTIAKGRSRYVCLQRLDDRLNYDPEHDRLFGPPEAEHLATYRRLETAFDTGTWDGDLDNWADGVPPKAWMPVTNDRAGCHGRRCRYYHQCPVFRARADVADADVVVANHDLVLTDLRIGGGVVLPNPAETIFILDEAHHLPDKTRDQFTAHAALRGCADSLKQVASSIETMARRFDQPREVHRARERLADEAGGVEDLLAAVGTIVGGLPFEPRDADTETHRFPLGEVPEPLAEAAEPLGRSFGGVAAILDELSNDLDDVVEGNLDWPNAEQAESWRPTIGQLAGRAAGAEALFSDYGDSSSASAARWVTRGLEDRREEVELTSVPLMPGEILNDRLWSGCHAALATSATLCALGTFDRFRESAGLAGSVRESRIASPFDFERVATFSVPRMHAEPSASQDHTEEIASLLPELLRLEQSALVLFNSWWQFNAVVESLPDDLRSDCRLQGEASKQRLIRDHTQAIDQGQPSYLFGLASFAEGVDLPGDYCRHVIMARIPFAVPDDPVDQAVAEWLENQGRNPFMELSLPDASLRLVQACGRLIRNENDQGRITLLDRRIRTRRYGESLLAALPPYRLACETSFRGATTSGAPTAQPRKP